MKLIIAWMLMIGGALLVASNGDNTVEIFVPKGAIVGQKYDVRGRLITRFLGVPYAKPPLGKLRFRRPVPIDKWTKPVQALNWPNNCIQNPATVKEGKFVHKNFSEDCLYLNIWSRDVNVNEHNRRPVLVWIHGGALLFGGSAQTLYDLETLAAMADAVLVSINYRVSALGFLYSDVVDDVKGNQGFYDQAMALEWINENIRYFGGDPKAITIMGESAGSWSVSAHILSPVSRHLFQRAIMMSGAINYKVVAEPQNLVPNLLKAIRQVGCANETDTSITQVVIECLELMSPEIVDKIPYLIDPHAFDFNAIAAVDGHFIPKTPNQMIAEGNFKKNFSLLVSTVEDEASFIFDRHHSSFSRSNPTPLSLEEAKSYLLEVVANKTLNLTIQNDTILKFYFAGLNGKFDNQDLFRKLAGVAYGDLILGCPTLNFAKQLYSLSDNSVVVYQWYYRAKLGRIKHLCSSWGGTCHTDDLYPVFGHPFRNEEFFHNRERELSREIINFIKAFIRTGTPGPDQCEWQRYFTGNNEKDVIRPYYDISNEYKSYQSFKFNLKQVECETIWGPFYQ